jgi:hypothetical protein
MNSRLAISVLLIAALPAFAQKRSAADLTILSRSILSKHCAKCHDDKAIRTDLRVLDHNLLTKDRLVPWVKAKEPTASQVIEMIEEGSMPPGRNPKVSADEVGILKEWIESGAAAYPLRFDDEFAYATILADAEKAGPETGANYRYLSLHHLADEGELSKARATFLAETASVLKAGAVIQPLDPTQTIFRFDLQKAGWHHKPFKKLNEKGEDAGQADGNLFDVVLLEYPYATYPEKSAAFDKLASTFLVHARQVRPVPFVRGDWFAEATTTSQLADDLRNLIQLFEPVPPGLAKPKMAELAAAKKITIPAVDAWRGADPTGDPSVKGLKVETIDFSLNMPKSRFAPNQRFRLRITAEEPMYYQLLWVDSTGKVDTRTNVEAYDPAKGAKDIILPVEGGLGDELGKERLTVFASPRPFAAGEAWRARHETKSIERFVHPFFAMKKRGEVFAPEMDDAKITRRTVYIEIAKKE